MVNDKLFNIIYSVNRFQFQPNLNYKRVLAYSYGLNVGEKVSECIWTHKTLNPVRWGVLPLHSQNAKQIK